MLISCKCLNFEASTGQIDQKLLSNAENLQKRPDCLTAVLAQELKKRQFSCRMNSNCLEFLRQAIGPISDLTTTINQNDLLYKVPLDTWLLFYCINCNKITHAKHQTDQTYLINSKLLTNKAEINSLKTSKSFSTAFNILMIDHQPTTPNQVDHSIGSTNIHPSVSNETVFHFQHSNSSGNISSNNTNDFNAKINQQKRLRNINQMLQQRLQKEIHDTDERIRRYSEQQFALLKNFREKSEQEYQLLVSLVTQVPEELKIIDAIDSNTIKTNTDNNINMDSSTKLTTTGAINNTPQQQSSLFVFNKTQQNQMPNLDTPPGTPENVPMSVGNSPTFRQQNSVFGGQRNNTNIGNSKDDTDCIFELDDFELYQSDRIDNMSDVEEIEDAADALGELESGLNIPKNTGRRGSLNIAKSLPISISNNIGSHTTKYNFEESEDEVNDDTVDIAASIKALAKSVHGNTVFGELPRPRFSTQI